MKKFLIILAVAINGFVFAQDSTKISPFYSTTTTSYDLNSFDLNAIYSLEKFSAILSERYNYMVECDDFVKLNGFVDMVLYIWPSDLQSYDCVIYTSLSVTEHFFKSNSLVKILIVSFILI
jgi:hypothetical protein